MLFSYEHELLTDFQVCMCIFKATNKNNHFPSQFCLRSISNKFENVDSKEVSFKVNVYDFLVDYDAIGKSNISTFTNN